MASHWLLVVILQREKQRKRVLRKFWNSSKKIFCFSSERFRNSKNCIKLFTWTSGIYTFSESFVPRLKIPNPKNRFCSLKMLNHPYYFSPSFISSNFKFSSNDSLTERLLKSFLFNSPIPGFVKEMAAKQKSSWNSNEKSTLARTMIQHVVGKRSTFVAKEWQAKIIPTGLRNNLNLKCRKKFMSHIIEATNDARN